MFAVPPTVKKESGFVFVWMVFFLFTLKNTNPRFPECLLNTDQSDFRTRFYFVFLMQISVTPCWLYLCSGFCGVSSSCVSKCMQTPTSDWSFGSLHVFLIILINIIQMWICTVPIWLKGFMRILNHFFSLWVFFLPLASSLNSLLSFVISVIINGFFSCVLQERQKWTEDAYWRNIELKRKQKDIKKSNIFFYLTWLTLAQVAPGSQSFRCVQGWS